MKRILDSSRRLQSCLLAADRKRNDNDNCTSRKDYDCRVKIDYQKRFLGNRGSGGICEAGFPSQRTNHPASCHRRTESEKGQLIAAIDPRDIALQYAATKSAYETASAQVERNKRLLSRQAISVQEYEISLANFQKAKSEYELSANNMRDTKLTAPFDGSIENDWWKTISVSTPVRGSCSLSIHTICVSNSPFRMRIFICCAPKTRVSL